MPTRRRLLAATATLPAVAGCVAAPIESGDQARRPELPPLDIEDEVRWAHEADDEPVGIEPVDGVIELPAEPVFLLRNDTDEELAGNPFAWGLSKLHDGKWYRIAPRMVPEPMTSVNPGLDAGFKFVFRHQRKRLDRRDFVPDEQPESRTEYDPIRHPVHVDVTTGLGGGWYAITLPLAVASGVTHAVALEVDAPAAPLSYDRPSEQTIEGDTAVFDYTGRDTDRANWYVIREVPADREADLAMIPESLSTRVRSPLRNGIAAVREHDGIDTAYVHSSISGAEFRAEPVIALGDRRYAIAEADPPDG